MEYIYIYIYMYANEHFCRLVCSPAPPLPMVWNDIFVQRFECCCFLFEKKTTFGFASRSFEHEQVVLSRSRAIDRSKLTFLVFLLSLSALPSFELLIRRFPQFRGTFLFIFFSVIFYRGITLPSPGILSPAGNGRSWKWRYSGFGSGISLTRSRTAILFFFFFFLRCSSITTWANALSKICAYRLVSHPFTWETRSFESHVYPVLVRDKFRYATFVVVLFFFFIFARPKCILNG